MNIRKAIIEDSEAIAALLMLASGEVIYKFIGEEHYGKGKDFLLHFVKSENNQYSFQNCYVAAEEGEIIAAVLVYDGAKLEELRRPVLEYVHQHFDANLNVEDETQAGEFYIDSLGVVTNHQGKGLGSTLLSFLIDEIVDKNGKTLGLLVDKTNPEAKRLYLKLGFQVVEEKQLLGFSLEHLQLSMKYDFTEINPSDYPEVIELWEASVRTTHDFLQEKDILYFKQLILNEYLKAVKLNCVRSDSGEILGFSGVAEGNLEMLFVYPDQAGKGIGKTLLMNAIINQQVTKVDVNEQNPKALEFYFNNGFEIIGRSEVDGTGKPYPILHMELRK